MPSLGPAEILVILVVALLVFGPNKMPEIARQVGKGMRELKRVQQHLSTELRDVVTEFDGPTASSTTDAGPAADAIPTLPPRVDTVPSPPTPAVIDPAAHAAPRAPTTTPTPAPPSDAPTTDRGQRVWPPPASPTSA